MSRLIDVNGFKAVVQKINADTKDIRAKLDLKASAEHTHEAKDVLFDDGKTLVEKLAEVVTGGNVDLTGYAKTADVEEALGKKVDAVDGKVLIDQAEVDRLADLKNYDDTDIKTRLGSLEAIDHSAFLKEIPQEYVTEEKLNAKGFLTEHQDISSLAVKTEVDTALENKVDKEEGKVLIEQTELERLAKVDNYDDSKLKELIKDELPFLEVYSERTILFYACGYPVIVEKNTNHKYDAEASEDSVVISYMYKTESVHQLLSAEDAAKLMIYGGYSNKHINIMKNLPKTDITVKGVTIRAIVGGSDFEGIVGDVNIDVEDSTLSFIHGAGFAGEAVDGVWPNKNIVHNVNMKLKDVVCDDVYVGPNGYGVLGTADVVVDGDKTNIKQFTMGGSNGTTRFSKLTIEKGTIDNLEGVCRGVVNKTKVVLNDGHVKQFNVGGRNEKEITGVIYECILALNGGIIDNFSKGISNKVELETALISGTIMSTVVTAGDTSMLAVIQKPVTPEYALKDHVHTDLDERITALETTVGDIQIATTEELIAMYESVKTETE